jgi:hypothetical protein
MEELINKVENRTKFPPGSEDWNIVDSLKYLLSQGEVRAGVGEEMVPELLHDGWKIVVGGEKPGDYVLSRKKEIKEDIIISKGEESVVPSNNVTENEDLNFNKGWNVTLMKEKNFSFMKEK